MSKGTFGSSLSIGRTTGLGLVAALMKYASRQFSAGQCGQVKFPKSSVLRPGGCHHQMQSCLAAAAPMPAGSRPPPPSPRSLLAARLNRLPLLAAAHHQPAAACMLTVAVGASLAVRAGTLVHALRPRAVSGAAARAAFAVAVLQVEVLGALAHALLVEAAALAGDAVSLRVRACSPSSRG